MKKVIYISISKKEVLTEDYSQIFSLIKHILKDKDKVLEKRNSWDVIFPEYKDDSREAYQIPEIQNWIKKSLDAGIPWFYLLNCDAELPGMLMLLLAVCCSEPCYGEGLYVSLSKEKLLPFLDKNFVNLNCFIDDNGLSDEIGKAATNAASGFILGLLK